MLDDHAPEWTCGLAYDEMRMAREQAMTASPSQLVNTSFNFYYLSYVIN